MISLLESDFGIAGDALKWMTFFLRGRCQRVRVQQASSRDFDVEYVVPQGSCLGSILVLLYMSRLFKIAEKHLPTVHGYADDTQLYLSFRPVIRLRRRIVQFWPWKRLFLKFGHCSFLLNLSLINDIKTEFIVIGTRQLVSKVDIASLKIGSAGITPLSSVRNLDAWFDDRMAMNVHVGMVCKKAFKGLYNIRQIRKLLSVESTKTLIHAFVTCHLDYCNSIVCYSSVPM
ncbi:uncharacterized protein [Montipora foliosa]|uniref:uncharacterized protein n=1 Tax=Montipora foliosa TaxID=591990 RepID=UPI0035F14B31